MHCSLMIVKYARTYGICGRIRNKFLQRLTGFLSRIDIGWGVSFNSSSGTCRNTEPYAATSSFVTKEPVQALAMPSPLPGSEKGASPKKDKTTKQQTCRAEIQNCMTNFDFEFCTGDFWGYVRLACHSLSNMCFCFCYAHLPPA